MSTFLQLQCPHCQAQLTVEAPGKRLDITCPNCSNVFAIAPQPDWVKTEINWLLELGTLSREDETFLRRISKKQSLGRLTNSELAKLAEIQNKGGEADAY